MEISFFADESCDFAVVKALRAAGYDVKTAKEMCAGADDDIVAQLAIKEDRLLLTEDKDFGQLVYAGSHLSIGVLFLRFPGNARSLMAETVVKLIKERNTTLKSRFVVIQPGRIRISDPISQ